MASERFWKGWYSRRRWRKLRAAQLAADPLCCMCLALDRVTAATVADHVVPHRGDEELFWNGELQSLCKHHHDSAKAREEFAGYSGVTDEDGYPLDPKHPQNCRPRIDASAD